MFDKYVSSVLLKLDALISNTDFSQKICDDNITINEFFKEKQIFVNGKEFKIKSYHLPYELKKIELWDLINNILDPSFVCNIDDVRYYYLEAISSRIKFLFFDALLNKNLNNVLNMIDKLIYEERLTKVFSEMF